uniref:Putative secreted protein n=1 Tax=Anopheles marajoara TaxID=58244 RepID=A0A2M4CA34_9DIPT
MWRWLIIVHPACIRTLHSHQLRQNDERRVLGPGRTEHLHPNGDVFGQHLLVRIEKYAVDRSVHLSDDVKDFAQSSFPAIQKQNGLQIK